MRGYDVVSLERLFDLTAKLVNRKMKTFSSDVSQASNVILATSYTFIILRDKRDDKRVGFYRHPLLMTKVNDWHREILMI